MLNVMYQEKMTRPWGEWEVIEKGKGYKIKKLTILPSHSISLQYHNHRSESWTIIEGFGEAIVDGIKFKVERGDTFGVYEKSIHKVTATSKVPLVAIEVQVGEITEESDIVRIGKQENNNE